MTTILDGVDYAWSHPGGAALRSAGMKFACRYLSHDVKKNLSRTEADDLAAHGLWSVVVFETTANRAGAGMNAGIADARTALTQAKTCGMPADRPIYFAVDYDAPPSAVSAYFQGVASVLTPARTGVYGGYRVVKSLLDSKTVHWAWQTVAWSGGNWEERAVIRQIASTVKINGVSCDKDFAYATDYGQWMPGKSPTPTEENMALSEADLHDIAMAVLTYRNKDMDAASVKATGKHIPEVYGYIIDAARDSAAALATVTELKKMVAALATAVAALPKNTGLTPEQVADLTAAGQALAKLGGAQ